MNLPELAQALLKFRDERNWAQFHTLRHLIVSLNLEAAELLELTQWKTDEELTSLLSDDSTHQALRDECADVLLYLLLIADKAGINLEEAARSKLEKNAAKYPIEKSYGSSRKYTQLDRASKD
ncbi:MAG: nucleotide pyrophosphohydrolase [Propionivibrio sp.]|nr:nucleotide pyrophosphohydrolase [Propionivibrio sp.]